MTRIMGSSPACSTSFLTLSSTGQYLIRMNESFKRNLRIIILIRIVESKTVKIDV